MTPNTFKSKLGRRFYTVFLLASLIPLLAVSSVIYIYTSNYLNEQREYKLKQEAKLFNVLMADRLGFISELIKSRTAGDTSFNPPPDDLAQYIEDVYTKPSEISGAPSDKLQLRSNDQGQIFIVAHNTQRQSSSWYLINQDYLFGNLTALSPIYSNCLIGDHDLPLYCTGGLTEKLDVLIRKTKVLPLRNSQWTEVDHEKDQQWRIQTYKLFLGFNLESAHWFIFTGIEDSEELTPINFFKFVFGIALALTFLLAMLISYRQISQYLEPLRRLTDSATALSKRSTVEPINVNSKDELEELGSAFNRMAKQVSQNFTILELLSEIDDQIIKRGELEEIAKTTWQKLKPVLEFDSLVFALTENIEHNALTIVGGNHELSQPFKAVRFVCESDHHLIARDGELITLTKAELSCEPGSILEYFTPLNFVTLFVFPVTIGGLTHGFIALGMAENFELSQDHKTLFKSLAERFSVSVADYKKSQALYHQAHYDFLTQLPNRKLLRDHLSRQLAKASKQGHQVAVVFVDLDNFKNINDSLGHNFGDQLLIKIGQRLTENLLVEEMVAREGGDEFILVIPNIETIQRLKSRLSSFFSVFERKFLHNGHDIHVSLSMGASVFPRDATEIDQLLMHADTALYKAKGEGKKTYKMYDSDMGQNALSRLELENDLWNSIDRDELCFFYQPLVNALTGKIGFEALIRWSHPNKGLISPAEFVEIAEQNNFIREINSWMFDEIFAQLKVWLTNGIIPIEKIAINISPLQLSLPNFLQHIVDAASRHGIEKSLIELEITEGVLIDNQDITGEILMAIQAAGISLALDDFGTGYSSLSYLQKLPFKRLKIDRSFVKNIDASSGLPPLVTAIINMAKSLDLGVTAEGIETAAQAELLKASGCDVLQGFYFSKPLPADECERFVVPPISVVDEATQNIRTTG